MPNNGDGPDGRDGEQPIGTLVQGNTVHEAGIYERQGTMWNQALSAQTRLAGNIFFNCDRAAVNVGRVRSVRLHLSTPPILPDSIQLNLSYIWHV
eukprot:COSAG03_NODE_6822_length_1001_cov_1.169623_1_plen_95_part_00